MCTWPNKSVGSKKARSLLKYASSFISAHRQSDHAKHEWRNCNGLSFICGLALEDLPDDQVNLDLNNESAYLNEKYFQSIVKRLLD